MEDEAEKESEKPPETDKAKSPSNPEMVSIEPFPTGKEAVADINPLSS